MVAPSEIPNGTQIYFEIGTGTVFKGVVLGPKALEEAFPENSFNKETLVCVDIDTETKPEDDSLPDHIAPLDHQEDSEQFERDAYSITMDRQEYIVRKGDVVEILS